MTLLYKLNTTIGLVVLLGLLHHLLLIFDTLLSIVLNATINYFRHWVSPKEMRGLVPFLQSAFASMGQVFGEICLISQIISFFACLGMSCLMTLPTINCACKQVRMIASIDERSVPSRLTCVLFNFSTS